MHTRSIPHSPSDDHDDVVRLHSVGWGLYKSLVAARGDRQVPRIAFLRGELELMSPGPSHERIKKVIARMLEAWAIERGVALEGVGAWTLEHDDVERGGEPDECYFVGRSDGDAPDLVLEVVWSHGALDKLSLYASLGVREVWIWEDGDLTVYVLRDGEYLVAPRSELLPGIDLDEMLRFANPLDQTGSVRAWQARLRETKG